MVPNLEALREDQQICLNEINKYFNGGGRLGYIKVATGWGKTYLAKHLMKQYYEAGKTILFLVSQNNQLLEQIAYIDEKRTTRLFPNQIELSSEHDRITAAELQDYLTGRSGFVIFASVQTLLSKSNEGIKDHLSKIADLVIIDEIHNFIDNKGNDFIDDIRKEAKVLGMTATPFQGVVGHVKFVDDINDDMREIFSKTLPQCIIEAQLSELDYVIIRSNQNILNIFDFPPRLSGLDNDELYLDCSSHEKINLIARRTKLAKQIYDDKIGIGNAKTLVFCAPVRNIVQGFEDDERRIPAFHAKMCSAIFNGELTDNSDKSFFKNYKNYTETDEFKPAVYLSSELSKGDKKAILDAFRAKDQPPFVLCAVGMLIEGFDFPDLENLMLLRPTLSMRVFEQQVGRVTRRKSNKNKGNIFEIADDIDSLYDTFKEQVFEGEKLERIQMLQPENRVAELFTDGNTTEAIKTGKINISEIKFGDVAGEYWANSVEIPPISLRAKYFCRLLSMIEERTFGKFAREKEKLMQIALGFKIHNIDSAKEILRVATLLERLEHEATKDPRLGRNCKKYKPLVFMEVRWLLLLRALTHLKHFNVGLDSREKSDILHILGFPGDYEQIEDYRIQCLKSGCPRVIDVSGLAANIKSLNRFQVMGSNAARQMLIPQIYWASCFTVDHPEIKDLFESKEWNYDVKRYVIR